MAVPEEFSQNAARCLYLKVQIVRRYIFESQSQLQSYTGAL